MKRRAVWKTVPHDKLIANIMNYIAPSPYGSVRTRSKRSRITPMRRILSFTDLIISCVTTWYWIYYGLHLRLYGAGLPPARDNPWKNRSVASVLSVIDFERGERAKGEWAYQWGTVFQTALLLFLLVIPRLRPGLLSLRSVLSSRQNLLQTTNMERSAVFQTKLITNYKHGV